MAVFAFTCRLSMAGHPLLSEDTGTQGTGNYELELGYDWSQQDGDRSFLFQPQLSWGASTTTDLIIQPSFVTDKNDGERLTGLGDTNLDAKWRFLSTTPWSLGVRAGLELPTAKNGLGLPHRNVSPHAVLVATGDFTPLTIDLNAGYGIAPADPTHRANLYHLSTAGTYEIRQRLSFLVDTSFDSNPDYQQGGRYSAIGLIGVIYTIRPGLDIDTGFRGRLNGTGPAQQFLLGITFRGAP
jgi:outer membrane putative beta-barrel porin/alpha-amylase